MTGTLQIDSRVDRLSPTNRAGWYLLYKVETCDLCGAEVLAPNSVNVRLAPEQIERLGLKIIPAPDDELSCNDDGDAVCPACL